MQDQREDNTFLILVLSITALVVCIVLLASVGAGA